MGITTYLYITSQPSERGEYWRMVFTRSHKLHTISGSLKLLTHQKPSNAIIWRNIGG